MLTGSSTFVKVAAVLLFFSCSNLSADWRPYHARYEVFRNGKLSGELEVSYEQNENRWNMSSEGTGTRGLAHFLRAKENEYAQGTFVQGRFRPISYTYYKRVAGNDDLWTAGFDWHQGTVDITRGKSVLTMDMAPGTVDALSLKLELRRRLRDRDSDLVFMQVDDDKIKEMVYRALEPEEIETQLGCLLTTPVERIHLGGTRFSRSWHAAELDFIMVRLQHGKSNGDDIEMRIAELRFDQQKVKSRSDCAALQVSE